MEPELGNDKNALKDQVVVDDDHPMEDVNGTGENSMPTPQQEEEVVRKKYGGMLPKKKPLISKDHERAFFDSADWALGKQGAQKPKGALEALRPKLQPTPNNQMRSRRSAYAPADDYDGDGGSNRTSSEEENSAPDAEGDNKSAPEDQSYHG
ncbi:uncharacterized protein LOC8281829 isoform X2 [Ricinus communis]|uniref:Negatively light-regulated protein n=1 Tax=Ricinus communis TaxID=3988 RepID=B9S8Z2_RICCO|nr:uncharacterized protein LOC8281829 isoform X2 [Ricinus communis]EEF39953.1 conserved hypothetical protein [Ricinus communis]|eukprot:XP_002522461.1 uncharacterized protein LOC8281829 isoform X2 [Ricinus communis]